MNRTGIRACVAAWLLVGGGALADAPRLPVEAFARVPLVSGVTLSPDGRNLAFIREVQGVRVAMASARQPFAPQVVVTSVPERFDVEWCRWKNARRLLCGFSGTVADMGVLWTETRLVAVDSDGSNLRVLVQNGRAGGSQFQDRVLDWLPRSEDRVLVALDDDADTFPSVFELDVVTGRLSRRMQQRPPLRAFLTDTNGAVRIGCGSKETTITCLARDPDGTTWRTLSKYEAFQRDAGRVFDPLGFGPEPGVFYARGTHEGRDALWTVDLADREPPRLVFSHPLVDVGAPLLANDGRLLGVAYDIDRPMTLYTDRDADRAMTAVNRALPGLVNELLERTPDGSVYVVRSSSDVQSPTYYLFEPASGQLARVGREYPELPPERLSPMTYVEYPARDGVRVPAYLTVPRGYRREKLPLVLLPHGGPIARDTWRFDFLVQFLASRGYAVLQPNFRGSSGYGDDWFHAAHQDWGGLTYSDVTDAAKWAIAQGIADPQRVCVVGWSFGGYAALLSAVRDGALYRCAASIAGVTELGKLLWSERRFVGVQIAREQIGRDPEKLKADSPARHARAASVPVLLVHGTRDVQVPVAQSREMVSALKRADKPHEYLELAGAGHSIEAPAQRAQTLTALERFLGKHLGPGLPEKFD